jgi:hypothetical protein
LTDAVEVQLCAVVERSKYLRQFPIVLCESVSQIRFLGAAIMWMQTLVYLARKYKQEESTIAAQCEPPNLPSRLFINDIDVFVARPVAGNLERGDRVA